MKPSAHFSLEEISCRCGCGQKIVDPALYKILERFRAFIGDRVMTTHCVNRCEVHNADVGGHPNSPHLTGNAWDGHVKTLSIKQLHKKAKEAYEKNILSGGLGFYRWGIHIDSWRKRTWHG